MARFVPSSFCDRSLIVPLVRVSWGGKVRPQNDHRTRNARWVNITFYACMLIFVSVAVGPCMMNATHDITNLTDNNMASSIRFVMVLPLPY